jgi:hypothetical protein
VSQSDANPAPTAYVTKHDASGNLLWLKKIGSPSYGNFAYGRGLAVDASGSAYVAGNFLGKVDADPGAGTFALSSLRSGGWYTSDAFVAKLNASGNFAWAVQLGGTGGDIATTVALDGANNVLVGGQFYAGSNDFDPGKGKAALTNAGDSDAFVVKLDPNHNFVWAKSWGGSGYDDIQDGLVIGAADKIYAAGRFIGTADLDPGAGTFNLTSVGTYYNTYISTLTSAGAFVEASLIGGSTMFVDDLAIDGFGNLYLTGSFFRTADFDPDPVATYSLISATNASGYQTIDTFVLKLVPSSSALAVTRSSSITSPASTTDAALLLMLTDDPLTTTKRK